VDDADLATMNEEQAWRDLERRLEERRREAERVARAARSTCRQCHDPLPELRRPLGICVFCQARREREAAGRRSAMPTAAPLSPPDLS